MKIYTSFIAVILFFITISAQEQIKVHYISQVSFSIEEGKDPRYTEMIKQMMQEVKEFDLMIDGAESTFKSVEKIDNKQKTGMRMSIGIPNSNIYKNVDEKFYIKNTHHDGYVEKDTLKRHAWQLSREKSKILNYDVRKAVITDSTSTIEAWYAPALAFKTGPEEYWGLPGLILKLEISTPNDDNFKRYFLADAIEIMEKREPLDIPDDGEMISAEKIRKLSEEQYERFKEMRSQGVDTSD